MSRKLKLAILLGTMMLLAANTVLAQDPRPTPTNVASGGGGGSEDDEKRGSISGFIYEDVNRDGQCVNTGVEGEEPIQGINVQFTSSDGETVITHYSGAQGDFGLYAAGQSYWEITVMPESGWVATTEATVYVPVYLESLNHENVNFCLSQGGANAIINLPGANSAVLLPESGASAAELQAKQNVNTAVITSIMLGLVLIFTGFAIEKRRRQLQPKPVPVKPKSSNDNQV